MVKVKLFESKLDLDSHENGGHTISKHVMTPDELLVKQNHWRFGKSSEFLSAYLRKENAELWTKTAIDLNKKSIAAWYKIAQDFDQKMVHYTSKASVGFGARPGDRTTTPLHSLALVLEKMPANHHNAILIVSSYPVMIKPKCYSIVVTKPESIAAKDKKTPRIDLPDDSMKKIGGFVMMLQSRYLPQPATSFPSSHLGHDGSAVQWKGKNGNLFCTRREILASGSTKSK